jgi:hypothetical protein
MVDHLADTDVDGFAWAQEVERLRDPSHWASLPRQRLCELGSAAGLTLESERITPMALDFADWLNRGGGDASSAELVRRLVDERSGGTECFQLTEMRGRLTLVLRIWTSAWTKR